MSGDLWVLARNGTTLLPAELQKIAADYDRLRTRVQWLENEVHHMDRVVSRAETLARNVALWGKLDAYDFRALQEAVDTYWEHSLDDDGTEAAA